MKAFDRYDVYHDEEGEDALWSLIDMIFRPPEKIAKDWTFYTNPEGVLNCDTSAHVSDC